MKITFFILFVFFYSFVFSQNEKMSYYFDTSSESNVKQYKINLFSKVIYFTNSKDSTYTMSIYENKDSIYARLFDYKKSILVNFELQSSYNNTNDLNKLINSRLYKYLTYTRERINKKNFEDFEYEMDTVNNQTLVHLTLFKNKKRKKIINEHYYYFTNKENIISFSNNNLKEYLLRKYNLIEIKNQNLEKTICVENGKKSTENEIVNIKKIDYSFSFIADQIFPKTNNFIK
jgi:hypothetical protein